MIHVAVVHRAYVDAILSGRKRIEARLTLTRREPFGRVDVGERIYFKASGGPFGATALCGRVETWEQLSPRGVRELRARHNAKILGEPGFWKGKLASRYATLIWLEHVEPIGFGPRGYLPPGGPAGRAWFVLPESMGVYPRCLGLRRAA